MEYYHDVITEQSWEELQVLSKDITNFVLIGGWAIYLYTHALKSKAIDVLIDYDSLEKFKSHYDLFKNDRLKKYEAVKGPVQIDLYLPHYSNLGIPVEDLTQKNTSIEGFDVLDINYLFALKLFTFSQRIRTPKGGKDFLDLISLFNSGRCDLKKVKSILAIYKLEGGVEPFVTGLNEVFEIKELNLNRHTFSRIKKEIKLGLS